MASHAFIHLVEGSSQQTISLQQVEELFLYYKEITGKTGQQLQFDYDQSAFPYECKQEEGYLSLTSEERGYAKMYIGAGPVNEEAFSFLQITLPADSKYGDRNKANEFSKFLAKKLKGELTLFNGRKMYYYKR
ncbi:DUF1885 family protein [Metabacillus indicus]|uniref:DUF1885 family protein n=1 Tax=Metabacillus indicus TaxID=246786 RepID=UPI003CF1097C